MLSFSNRFVNALVTAIIFVLVYGGIIYAAFVSDQEALKEQVGVESIDLPVDRIDGDVERGKAVFVEECAVCHGEEGQGELGPAIGNPGLLALASDAFLKYAIEHDYDRVLNMDADFSHQPKYIPALLAGMDDSEGGPVDVMIGSRYVPGGGAEGWLAGHCTAARSVPAAGARTRS